MTEPYIELSEKLLHYDEQYLFTRSGIRPSDVGNCIRQTWYKYTNTPPDPNQVSLYYKDKFIMGLGNLYEQYFMDLFSKLGIPYQKIRVSNKELGISGETDPVITINNEKILAEMKLTHDTHYMYLYNDAKRGVVPESYNSQIQTYLWLLPEVKEGWLFIGNRSWRRNSPLPPFFIQPVQRDENWKKINFGARLPLLNSHLLDNTIPDREYSDVNLFPCSYCPYKERCYAKE